MKKNEADYDGRPATLATWLEYLRKAGFAQFGDDGVPVHLSDKKRRELGLPPRSELDFSAEKKDENGKQLKTER